MVMRKLTAEFRSPVWDSLRKLLPFAFIYCRAKQLLLPVRLFRLMAD